MRVYVAAGVDDLRRLEADARLPDDGRLATFAVTPWALTELDVDDPEDEGAEFAVLSATAQQLVAGRPAAAVLVFDLPVAELPFDGLQVTPGGDLPRRRLAAVHLTPALDWYAGHELPDVVAAFG